MRGLERTFWTTGLKTTEEAQPKQLALFVGNPRNDSPKGLPFTLEDYLELVDWTGRQIREDKRGHIDNQLPPILDRLQIEPKHWLFMARNFESSFKGLVGTAYRVKDVCRQMGYQRASGISPCRQLLGAT